MTPVKKTLENAEGGGEEEKKTNIDDQLTQLEARFRLDKIDIHIDEALNSSDENDEGQPFLYLTLQSIIAKTKIKTFDMEFDASLANLIVYHEQFIGKDNQQLRLLSAEINQTNESYNDAQKLVSVHFLHTSPDNPLFSSPMYSEIENRAHVHMTKLVVTLQLEALLSILRFQDALVRKLPKDQNHTEERDKKQDSPKIFSRSVSTQPKPPPPLMKRNGLVISFSVFCNLLCSVFVFVDVSATPTLKIKADLEEFRVIIASKVTQLFDIQVQGVKGDVSQAPEKTFVNLILSDLRVFDPYEGARYRKVFRKFPIQKQ